MKIRTAIFLLALLLTGCGSTPLFVSDDQVSIYLRTEPEVKEDEFRIRFRFDSPTGDTHLVQRLEFDSWQAEEAFRVTEGYKSHTDSHWSEDVNFQHRRMVIRPGAVDGVDETPFGFSMLPGPWPPGFNEDYRDDREIRGYIVYLRPEHATVYTLTFDHGVLTWQVEGTDIKHVWRAEGE